MFSRLPKVGKMNTPMHVRLLNLTAFVTNVFSVFLPMSCLHFKGQVHDAFFGNMRKYLLLNFDPILP